MVLKARPVVGPGNRLGAGAVREQPFQEIKRFSNTACGGKRAEVPRSVVCCASSNVDAREIFSEIYFDVGICFVILEADVKARFVLLDERIFKQQRLLFGFGDDVLEIGNAIYKFERFGVQILFRAKVRSQPIT